MKRLLRVACLLLAAVGLAVGCLAAYSAYLDGEIARLYAEREDAMSLINGDPVKDKGNVLIGQASAAGDLFVLGSSEFSSPASENIKYEFPNSSYTGNVSCIGHAYVQNALHAMDLGANAASFASNDVVIIESIQWFFGPDIDSAGFMSNFSELQFYEFLNNDKISQDNKRYLCSRFLEIEAAYDRTQVPSDPDVLPTGNSWARRVAPDGLLPSHTYPQTHVLATLYLASDPLGKVLYQLVRPYFYVYSKLAGLKDRYDSYQALLAADASYEKPLWGDDWDNQLDEAQVNGESACTNNDIYVYDGYWTTYLADNWSDLKDSMAGTTTLESGEWDDYRFLMSVCNELGIKPLLVTVPVNAYYYDYAGFDPASRQAYYEQSAELAAQYGIPQYNGLVDKEYEPYVFADVMHLGWRGWVYVAQAVTEHFE